MSLAPTLGPPATTCAWLGAWAWGAHAAVLTAPRPQAGPCAWLGRLGAHAATPTQEVRADAGGKGGVRGATLTCAPRAVPGGHVLGVAVGDRVELRQLQRQVQVQARVVGEARLARAGALRVNSLACCLMATGLV